MLYFAYGSNLDYARMFSRCKNAEVYSKAELDDYKLVFMENNSGRMVANIVESKGDVVQGILYNISEKEAEVLDRFEGFPYVYDRAMVDVIGNGMELIALTYIMDSEVDIFSKGVRKTHIRRYGVPKEEYFNHIVKGFTMFNLPQRYLMEAYIYSKDRGEE